MPHLPFAEWADLPFPGQLVVGLTYEESEAYHVLVDGRRRNITWHANGESYGIDINQGYVGLQYGLAPRWAADLSIGGTTVGWRSFDQGRIQSTTGLMDWTLGVRYQILEEEQAPGVWTPTLTFRAGAVLPGSYNQNITFAPGLRSVAIEPELLLRKHFGWPGLGIFGDVLYRWNRTTGNDQYITAIGFFQQIKGWELDVGYRHLQTLSGSDLMLSSGLNLYYPRDPRENSDAIDAGFSYTTSRRHFKCGFHARTIIDGNNTDSKLWVGASLEMPFDLPLFKSKQ
ncbi:MAG TPA: hypothetical protein VL793_01350 [Patescibacteria group bacterium]|nr:hypothetical protein [Patescibacteria group bacterium]